MMLRYVIISVCSVAALSIITFERNKIWIEETSVWLDSVKKSPHKRSSEHSAFIYYGIGQDFAGRALYDDALTMFRKAIFINPAYAKAIYQMGVVYNNQGNTSLAFAMFARVVELDPQNEDAIIARGVMSAQQGSYDAAIEDFDRAIRFNKKSESAYYNRGSALYKKGNPQAAIKSYTAAVRLNPSYAEAYHDRAISYRFLGNRKYAARDFQKACDLKLAKACSALSNLMK